MPTTGTDAIATKIGEKTFTVMTTPEGDVTTTFSPQSGFVKKLAAAIDAGWTSASPSTPTTMADAFTQEFLLGDELAYLAGNGAMFVECIATAIDQETTAWAGSWISETAQHTYTVSESSIVARAESCTALATADPDAEPPVPPFWSNGAKALAEAVAAAFVAGFLQEEG